MITIVWLLPPTTERVSRFSLQRTHVYVRAYGDVLKNIKVIVFGHAWSFSKMTFFATTIPPWRSFALSLSLASREQPTPRTPQKWPEWKEK